MKKNHNKNYMMYWFTGISAIMTIPAAIIIFQNMNGGSLTKTIAIMATFLILLIAITLLYKFIFGVSVQEITSEEKITELDRIVDEIASYARRYRNPQLLRNIEIATSQTQKFKKRKSVLIQIAGGEEEGASAITNIIQTVEDALVGNLERISNRIEIFDDEGIPEIVRKNIEYINELLWKNNDILLDFENLITEMSRSTEVNEEKDINKLKDMVNAMKSLRSSDDDNLNDLKKKYEGKIG